MRVNLFWFAKNPSATTRPIAESAYVMDGTLRDASNILSPVIGFDFGAGGNVYGQAAGSFNYAHIPNTPFFRYYYITNWTYDDGLWWATMSVDVLATYSIQIANTSAYVLRASNQNAWNTNIIDTTYPTQCSTNTLAANIGYFWNIRNRALIGFDPCFIVGIINNDQTTARRGAVAYYAMTTTQLQMLMGQLLTESPDWLSVADSGISASLAKMLVNPAEYIYSCRWFPNIDLITDQLKMNAVTTIPYGWWNINTNAVTLNPNTLTLVVEATFDIPKHPASSTLAFFKSSAYCSYVLHIPPWGDVSIDPELIYNLTQLRASVEIDPLEGGAVLLIQDPASNVVLARYDGRIGVDVATASIAVKTGGAKSLSDLGMIGGSFVAKQLGETLSQPASELNANDAVGENALQQADVFGKTSRLGTSIINVATNTANAILANSLTLSSSGVNESVSCYYEEAYIECRWKAMSYTSIANYGFPSHGSFKLGDIAGFIKTAEPINLRIDTATKTELDMIRAHMMGGFTIG